MIFENKKLRRVLTELLGLSKRLFSVETESKTVYDLDNTIEDYGMINRLWNNTTYFTLDISSIDRIVVSEELSTAVLFINSSGVVYGSAIPLGIFSLSGVQLFAAYGNTDKISFSRICNIIFSMVESILKDIMPMANLADGIYGRGVYIVSALIIRLSAQKSISFSKYASVRNIIKTLNEIAGIDVNEDFSHATDIMEKLKNQSFMEIIKELFYENSLMNFIDEYNQSNDEPEDDKSTDNVNPYDELKEKINQVIDTAKTTAVTDKVIEVRYETPQKYPEENEVVV